MIQDFPAAYVIPKTVPFQVSPHQPARLIDFLIFNDVQVEQQPGGDYDYEPGPEGEFNLQFCCNNPMENKPKQLS